MSQRLKTFELLRDFAAGDLELLDDLLEERDFDDESMIFCREEEAEELFLILEGGVRIELDGQTLGTLPAGEALGAAGLLVIGKRQCDAVAQGPTRILSLGRQGYHRLRLDSPSAALVLTEGILRSLGGLARAALAERHGDVDAA